MPVVIATLVSKRMATLRDLQEFYGTQDIYDMLEIVAIDAHNDSIMREA